MTETKSTISATGRRKESVARVQLCDGSGVVIINKRPFDNYFKTEILRAIILQPFSITKTEGKFDAKVLVTGGGISGQAAAIRLGISRALVSSDESFKKLLRASNFLTRDSRIKERKKYGQKGARKKFQYTKR